MVSAVSTARWEGIRALVAELGRAEVRAGVVGDAAAAPHPDADLTVGELTILHEFGNEDRGGHIPERSFVRKTMRDPQVQAGMATLTTRLTAEVIAGRLSRDEALKQIGEWAAARIREKILNHEIAPEDAPSTVAKKGHDVVLLETGVLAEAVGWEIRK